MSRYRICAWGSSEHPDLDYEADDYPRDLGWKYPSIEVSCLSPLRLSDLKSALGMENSE